jgi:putative SOS response-associated peptidase YedK
MPYYNSCTISSAELTFMGRSKELKPFRINRPVQSGFDFKDWPVLKPVTGEQTFEIREIHWEYIPDYIHDEYELLDALIMNTWLTCRGENLFKNEKNRTSINREGALYGRCLILSSGFFEWRHVPVIGKRGKPLAQTEKIPYFITLKHNPEYFFMAGVSRVWTNRSRNQSADTFAIVTTEANELMAQVHNNKKRMPVILNEGIAERWLKGSLPEKEIADIAAYQYASEEMIAWPVEKGFMNKTNPCAKFKYENLPPL